MNRREVLAMGAALAASSGVNAEAKPVENDVTAIILKYPATMSINSRNHLRAEVEKMAKQMGGKLPAVLMLPSDVEVELHRRRDDKDDDDSRFRLYGVS
jgi:hypothetical protein